MKRFFVVIAVAAMISVAGACSDEEQTRFSFADNDLCEWVSETEVTRFVSEAYSGSGIEWDGSVSAVEPVGSAWDLPGTDYCRWETIEGGHVIARGLAPSDFGPVSDYSEWDQESMMPAVSGHPEVPEGIIAANAAFGRYGFWVERSDEALGLEVVFDGVDDWEQEEMMLFAIADSFLAEMGWTA